MVRELIGATTLMAMALQPQDIMKQYPLTPPNLPIKVIKDNKGTKVEIWSGACLVGPIVMSDYLGQPIFQLAEGLDFPYGCSVR